MPRPFGRPVADWPELLLGPMLPRVTSRSVSVLVALEHPATVELELHQGNAPAPGAAPLCPGTRGSVALGKHLHVALVEARLTSDLAIGTV
jgi:hypothetical protein